MMKKFLCASVATAMIVGSITPAAAQSFAMSEQQAPLGATATVNFKVPLGAAPTKARKPTYGLTLAYGQRLDSLTSDGRVRTRESKLADLRFTDGFKLHRAEVMTFDLGNLDDDPRLNMGPDKGKETTWLWVGGAVVIGVGLYFLLRDDDDDDEFDSIN